MTVRQDYASHNVATQMNPPMSAFPRLLADIGGTNVRFALELSKRAR